MRSEPESGDLRRYVLGTLSESESDVIERDYFAHADALDLVDAAEEDLIDEYLANRLSRQEREQFERHYLSTPTHRRRVAVARQLRAAAAARSVERPRDLRRWWAAAAIAASVILVVGGVQILRFRSQTSPSSAAASTVPASPGAPETRKPNEPDRPAPTPEAPSPVVVAVSISPILVRGSARPSTVVVESGTDLVRVVLQQGERRERPVVQAQAVVRTVAGHEVWRGAAGRAASPLPKELARLEIPAALLHPDDYIVELLETNARGAVSERYRYFLRVRAP